MIAEWMEWHRNDEIRLEWMEWHWNEWNDIGMNGMMMNTMINWFEMTKWLEELANLRIKGHALIKKILHFTLVLVIWTSFWDDKMIIEWKKRQPNEVKPLPIFRSLVVLSFQNDKEMTNEDRMTAVKIFSQIWKLSQPNIESSFQHHSLLWMN